MSGGGRVLCCGTDPVSWLHCNVCGGGNGRRDDGLHPDGRRGGGSMNEC